MTATATNLAILGLQWGDEGKGKLVDLLSAHFRNVVRFQGGNNAGHTVVVDGQTIALHQVPSGALHPDCFLVVGSGVVLNLEVFLKELDNLRAKSFDLTGRLLISDRAHVILPHHIALDLWREGGANKIGTTGRGIGPAYEMKASRMGVRMGDLLHPATLADRIRLGHEEVSILLGSDSRMAPVEEVTANLARLAEPLLPMIGNAQDFLWNAWRKGESILFEGAQATLLDIDHGTYPYVTSSLTAASAACSPAPGCRPRPSTTSWAWPRPTPPGSAPAPCPRSSWTPPASSCARWAASSAPPPGGPAAAAGSTPRSPATPAGPTAPTAWAS